ncbi:hypothetical protein SNEBB_011180 [Seison nebaliae]|nr:hypothetical protein SNEBB_011180 [Seison nebaliae]
MSQISVAQHEEQKESSESQSTQISFPTVSTTKTALAIANELRTASFEKSCTDSIIADLDKQFPSDRNSINILKQSYSYCAFLDEVNEEGKNAKEVTKLEYTDDEYVSIILKPLFMAKQNKLLDYEVPANIGKETDEMMHSGTTRKINNEVAQLHRKLFTKMLTEYELSTIVRQTRPKILSHNYIEGTTILRRDPEKKFFDYSDLPTTHSFYKSIEYGPSWKYLTVSVLITIILCVRTFISINQFVRFDEIYHGDMNIVFFMNLMDFVLTLNMLFRETLIKNYNIKLVQILFANFGISFLSYICYLTINTLTLSSIEMTLTVP